MVLKSMLKTYDDANNKIMEISDEIQENHTNLTTEVDIIGITNFFFN